MTPVPDSGPVDQYSRPWPILPPSRQVLIRFSCAAEGPRGSTRPRAGHCRARSCANVGHGYWAAARHGSHRGLRRRGSPTSLSKHAESPAIRHPPRTDRVLPLRARAHAMPYRPPSPCSEVMSLPRGNGRACQKVLTTAETPGTVHTTFSTTLRRSSTEFGQPAQAPFMRTRTVVSTISTSSISPPSR